MQQQIYIKMINAKGQIVIPHKIRKALKLKRDSVCKVTMDKGNVIVKSIKA